MILQDKNNDGIMKKKEEIEVEILGITIYTSNTTIMQILRILSYIESVIKWAAIIIVVYAAIIIVKEHWKNKKS